MLLAVVAALGISTVELGLRAPAESRSAATVEAPARFTPAIDRLRAAPERAIDDRDSAAVVSGVVFGRPEGLSLTVEEKFLRSGLWHLLAASGQNVALVAGLALLVAWSLGGTRVHGVLLGLVAVPAYVLVVGGGPSIVRAGIMGELALLGWLAGRLRHVWHGIAMSMAILVWVWPGVHRTLGFQLSYLCVAALVVWCAPLTDRLARIGVPRALAAALAATIACSAATAPVLALRTGEAPLAGAVANLLAVPVASAMLVLGLPIAILAAAGVPGAAATLDGVALPAKLLLLIAAAAADLPGASTTSTAVAVGGPAAALAAWLLGRGRSSRSLAAAVAALVVAGTLGLQSWQQRALLEAPGHRQVRVSVLDVGQGDATLLQSSGAAVLVDTGPPRGGVVARARSLGVRRVDGIVLTHDSLDHRGGLRAAVRSLRPRWLAMPADAAGDWGWVRELGPPLVELCRGSEVALPTVQLHVLHPRCGERTRAVTGDEHNDNALVALVTSGRVRILLASDAEAPIVMRLRPGRVHMLRVAHHGSADPMLPALLRELRPVAAAISVGRDNPYRHPRPDTLAALARARVATWRTDRHGSVVFETDGERLWRVAL